MNTLYNKKIIMVVYMSCGRKIKSKVNAYIYGKCGINKNIIKLSRNLDTIKCIRKSCNLCSKCGANPCKCLIDCSKGNCFLEAKIKL